MMDMPYASMFGQSKRQVLLTAVATVLVEQRKQVLEMQEVIEQTGLLYEDFKSEFEDLDDILLLVVQGVSKWIVEPLVAEPEDPLSYDDMIAALVEFSRRYSRANATILPGVFRVFFTESSRRSKLQNRFFEAGPASITGVLVAFVERAQSAVVVKFPASDVVAEALMGLLREPLYRELAIHSERLSPALLPADRAPEIVRMFAKGCAGGQGS